MNRHTFNEEISQLTINLPRAAMVYARAIAYPDLDVDSYLARIEVLADQARAHIQSSRRLADRIDGISDYLFYQANFQGNRENYYDPRNSFLNEVLDRKLGVPISLAVIWMTIAQKLGIPAYGVGLPGHFIVGINHPDGHQLLIDPFNTGLRLTIIDCDRLVRESTGYQGVFQTKWLAAVSPIDLLARMLTNLCHAYIRQENWPKAIPVIEHLLVAQPEMDWHLRDLGYVLMYNGSLRRSAQYLEEYLRRNPEAPDFENVRTSLQIVAGRLALWN
jgi:regulator of sirC expression with transglutaminase-like and TPR domain